MREIVYEQYVARPVQHVWRFLSDLRNDCAWRQEVSECELLTGEAGTAPSAYRETVSWEGRQVRLVLTVTEIVEASRIVVTGEDQTYGTIAVWTLEPREAGSQVTLAFTMETKGAAKLVEPFMWAIVTRWLERDLPRLENHL